MARKTIASARNLETVLKPAEPPVETYNCPIPLSEVQAAYGPNSQFFYWQWAFGNKTPIEYGAPLRPDLFRKIAEKLVPGWFEWHDWTNTAVRVFCEEQWIGIAGCAGSAKTRNMAGMACLWWLCNPMESSVIFCSTTAKALRKRGWSEVQNFYAAIAGPRVGHFVDSRMMWQAEKGDDRHAIMGIAIEEGETTKISDNIKGVHTTRQLVIIDEATAVPPAIFEACTNLYAYPSEFMMVMLGNPRQKLDEFGKFCEPAKGWSSVNVDMEEWETTPKINGRNGVCIRFDAEKSPNIIYPLENGKLVSRHLPTREKVEARRNKVGSENDPSYWSNDRGFWAPEGVNKNVFTETLLIQTDAYGKHRFTGVDFQIIGALDPARTGDRPALRFAAMGEMEDGNIGVELMPPLIVPLDARSSNPLDFQLAEATRRACDIVMYRGQKYHCPPENLGIDATGGGASTCDIFQRIWSPDIIRVGFGNAASIDACSHEDVRPANEVYKNLRAEMYFRTKSAFETGQLKGLDIPTAKELCSLTFDDNRPLIILINKADYKKHYGSSPDFADTVAIVMEVAKRRGFKLAVAGLTVRRHERFAKVVEEAQSVFNPDDFYITEEEPETIYD